MYKHKNEKLIALVFFIISLIWITSLLFVIFTYSYPDWFFDSKYYSPYTTHNVVGRFAIFCYFTKLTELMFSIWSIFLFIAVFTNNLKLKKFVYNPYLVVFITTNQIITFAFFNILQPIVNGTLGYVREMPFANLNFAIIIYEHFIMTLSMVLFFYILYKPQKVSFLKMFYLYSTYLLIYFTIVRLVGDSAFDIKWYPYPIFTADAIWFSIFKSLDSFNYALASLIQIGILFACLLFYLICCYFLKKHLHKKLQLQDFSSINHIYYTCFEIVEIL